ATAATFASTVDGGNDLTLTAGTIATMAGGVGSTTPVGDGTGAAITLLGGAIEFVGTVTTASGISASNTAPVTFRENVTVNGNNTTGNTFLADVTFDGLTFQTAV